MTDRLECVIMSVVASTSTASWHGDDTAADTAHFTAMSVRGCLQQHPQLLAPLLVAHEVKSIYNVTAAQAAQNLLLLLLQQLACHSLV